jgi:alpha-tubulin suppressor-like RCC1 family protein
VTAIAASGLPTALALRQDGTVWTFGTWNTIAQLPPAPVAGLSGVTAIAGSGGDAYALRSDGTVWAWGRNLSGQLGNGSPVEGTASPVQVSGLTGVTAIAAGASDAVALKSDGTVWMWGGGAAGFGGGTPGAMSNVPVQVTGLANVTSIASSGISGGLATSLAVESDGTLWAWGDNTYGELGNGTHGSTVSYTVNRVSGLPKVTSAATGWTNSYAVGADGSAWAWGFNNAGQLANGVVGQACLSTPTPTGCESDVPLAIAGLSGVTSIAAGGYLGLPTAYAIVGKPMS